MNSDSNLCNLNKFCFFYHDNMQDTENCYAKKNEDIKINF